MPPILEEMNPAGNVAMVTVGGKRVPAVILVDTDGNMAPVRGINWKGAWSAVATYAVYDAVSSGGSSYICTAAHTNQEPPNASYWDVLAQGA